MSGSPLVYCIFRQSTEYTIERYQWFARQCARAGARAYPLHNYHGGAYIGGETLLYDWPGWWAKMELFRPGLTSAPLLYMDLDTVILNSVRLFLTVDRTTLLSDFYRPEQLQSSVMFLTPEDRARVWAEWIKDPAGHISRFSVLRPGFNGDQNFVEEVLGRGVQRWQDVPGCPVCSYKVHVRKGHEPRNGLIVFHGKPRPWEVAPWSGM